jgi:hypothetical protein
MNKEQILQSFLEDELFVEKGYLRTGEAQQFTWSDPRKNKLIEVLRITIDGVIGNEGDGAISLKVNRILNQQP